MNIYKLDRYEGTYAILVQEDEYKNELSILKDRLAAFANPGDRVRIDFDTIGNLKNVEIIVPDGPVEKT